MVKLNIIFQHISGRITIPLEDRHMLPKIVKLRGLENRAWYISIMRDNHCPMDHPLYCSRVYRDVGLKSELESLAPHIKVYGY